jgi:hypothetical protein
MALQLFAPASRERALCMAGIVGSAFGMLAGQAYAVDIPVKNPDLAIRLDTSIRYNLGMRMKDIAPKFGNNSAYDESNYLFKKHDVITNRVDVLTELDIAYQNEFGVRVSAAGWYDNAYGKTGASNPAFGKNTSYPDNVFTSNVTRFYHGPSGEILDAFVYGNISFSGIDNSVKIGRHAVLWGESMFGNTHAISNSQTPNDGRKGISSPGASAKETALPIGQISLNSQVADNITVGAQYVYEWRSNRIPEGGTFFAGADSVLYGPPRVSANPLTGVTTVGRGPAEEGKGGDWGVSLHVRPEWLDGTVGVYYRRYDEKNPWAAQLALNPARTLPVYARGVKLYGISLAKNIMSASVGAELSYREDAALNSAGAVGPRFEGARGNTLHGLINASYSVPKMAAFDTAIVAAELQWSHLRKVTRNAAAFRAPGYVAACNIADPVSASCADKDYFNLSLSVTPTWSQVLPGVDIMLPVFTSLNLKGNSANNGGGNEGLNTYKVGVNATFQTVHSFDLAYQWWDVKTAPAAGSLPDARSANGAPFADKAFLQFTYSYAF